MKKTILICVIMGMTYLIFQSIVYKTNQQRNILGLDKIEIKAKL